MYSKYSELTTEHLEFLDKIAAKKHFTKQVLANKQDLINHQNHFVEKEAMKAFELMKNEATKSGFNIHIVSAFRDFDDQVCGFFREACPKGSVFNPIQHIFGFEEIKLVEQDYLARAYWVAPVGYSEHHTGKAIDLCEQTMEFAQTTEYAWLTQNASKFGFIQSYPQENSTGCGFEPWHWLYVAQQS